jgi:hypothetical protein
MTKRDIFLLILVASLSSARADDGGFAKPDWIPDAKTVTAIDKEVLQLRQPKDLPPLAAYSRHYQGMIVGENRRIVSGVLIAPMMDAYFKNQGFKFGSTTGLPPGVHIILDRRESPGFADGGCGGQEYITYDMALKKITEAHRNGIEPVVPKLPFFGTPVPPPLVVPAIPPSISIKK